MIKITDKRKQVQAKPLTFGELEVGDWFEYVDPLEPIRTNAPLALRRKLGATLIAVFDPDGRQFQGDALSDLNVRRLDVEIVIHGEKP